jgi:predicted  nucleic acid-binding Zn-ribbon protein
VGKTCIHCGKILKLGRATYKRGACIYCTNTLPEYSDFRKQSRAERFRRYYLNNQEKEKLRAQENRRKKRESKHQPNASE